MKTVESININRLLFTALPALLCALVLLWFKSKAMMPAAGGWLREKNELLVSCSPGTVPEKEGAGNKQRRGNNDGNGCSHQLAGALCPTHKAQRKHQQRNVPGTCFS